MNWYLVVRCEMSESTVIGGLPSPAALGKSSVEDIYFLTLTQPFCEVWCFVFSSRDQANLWKLMAVFPPAWLGRECGSSC